MLEDILLSKKDLLYDGVETVIRAQQTRQRRVTLVKGNLFANTRTEMTGVNALVRKNGVHGFASTSEYNEEAIKEVVKSATENALFLDKNAPKNKGFYPPVEKAILPLNTNIVDFEQKKFIDLCKTIDDYIVKHCEKIVSRNVVYTEDSMDKIILSSHASSGHCVSPRCYIYVFLTAEGKNGQPLEMFKAFGGYGHMEDHFSNLAPVYEEIDKIYHLLMDKCEGVYAEAGVKTVVMAPELAGMIAHEAVGHTVEADLVMGGSVAGKYLNKQVASPLITMVDYASECFGKTAPLPVYMDDEGVKAKDCLLIENGILKGYMNNRSTAETFGVEPCGNARGWLFSDEPIIRMRNTFVLPGKDKLEDMIAGVEDGYYLISTGNGQADLTGEFMFGVNMGYEIKHGKLGKAILDTTVTGIAFDLLKTVDAVSDNVEYFSSGFCGKKQPIPVGLGGPYLRCKMTIGGR